MHYANLGTTGLKVSRLCLGCMIFGAKELREYGLTEKESRPFIRRASEAGINFFDTADVYSRGISEEVLGRAGTFSSSHGFTSTRPMSAWSRRSRR
jgi:1-deoxyxylulose-5-phosphate synthase